MTFQVEIETTSRRIDLDVIPSKDDQYYFASYMEESIYEQMGFAEHPEEFKAFWIAYLEDYVNEEYDLSHFLWKGPSSQTFEGLSAMPGKDYVTCIFGIEPDFKYTTEIHTERFSTKPRQGTPVEGVTFEITAPQISSFGASINYKVAGPEVTWLSFLQTKTNFDADYEGDASKFLTAERDRFERTLISQGRTWSNYLRTATDFDEQWDILDSETEYVIVAAGISEDGAIITEPSAPFVFATKKSGTGVDIVQETEHFRFSITNLTGEKCRWAVEPLETPGEYEYMYAEAMPLEAYPDVTGTDDLTQFGAIVSDIFNRNICREFWYKPNPDNAMYLEAFELYYWKSFLTDPRMVGRGVRHDPAQHPDRFPGASADRLRLEHIRLGERSASPIHFRRNGVHRVHGTGCRARTRSALASRKRESRRPLRLLPHHGQVGNTR